MVGGVNRYYSSAGSDEILIQTAYEHVRMDQILEKNEGFILL